MRASGLRSKDLLGIEPLSPDEINLILDTAEGFKEVSERPVKKVPALRGQLVINLFMEPQIHVDVPEIKVPQTVVNVPAAKAPVVNVAAPKVTVQMPKPGNEKRIARKLENGDMEVTTIRE